MAIKYNCGPKAVEDYRKGKPTVEQNYNNDNLPSLDKLLLQSSKTGTNKIPTTRIFDAIQATKRSL